MNPEARTALLAHYDAVRRDLPWRGESDPYRILVSEVMLQQTRVDTVVRYYEPWLRRFPDVESLADADVDEVLREWEGLGYYRRARNLHAAVRAVRERPGGEFPETALELRALPGVGEYTAGAVASIAFGEVAPAVDGNVRRVLSRWFDEPEPTVSWLRARATELVHLTRPGDWNQALMELGAVVCTPRNPKCAECPVSKWCAARAAGSQAERPVRARKPRVRAVDMLLVVLQCDGRVLLVRRPDGGLLGGMWAFPESEMTLGAGAGPTPTEEMEAEIATVVRGLDAAIVGPPLPLETVVHRFTHLHVTYRPYIMKATATVADGSGRAWVSASEAGALAIPVAQRRVLDQLTWEVR